MLDVDRRNNIDPRLEQQKDVFVALYVAAALNVSVCKLINQCHARLALQNGIHVHLRKDGALVID